MNYAYRMSESRGWGSEGGHRGKRDYETERKMRIKDDREWEMIVDNKRAGRVKKME